jgi:hypothetical protein
LLEVWLNIFTFLKTRGLSCPCCVQPSLSRKYLYLTIPGFPYNLLPVSYGEIGFKKIIVQVLAWKFGYKMPLLPVGPSCPLQAILLQVVMAVWSLFFYLVRTKQPLYRLWRAVTPDQQVQI